MSRIAVAVGSLLLLAACAAQPVRNANVGAPPNEPARVRIEHGVLTLEYDGRTVLRGDFAAPQSACVVGETRDAASGALTQRVTLALGAAAAFVAELRGGPDSFACESDRPADREPIVRHVFGAGASRLDRALYDRGGDWVLSAGAGTAVELEPLEDADGEHRFRAHFRGREVELVFRPRFYQKHRGLSRFEPWRTPRWRGSVAGWCSWFAYGPDVTEAHVRDVADVLARRLAPYGLEYVQIDDGYQRTPFGRPSDWLEPNDKFPSGLAALAETIRARGLKPGLWLSCGVQDARVAEERPELFVRDPQGHVAVGNWIGRVPDYSRAETLDFLTHPVYRTLAAQGWAYVKLDTLRHLRYEGYNSQSAYFRERGLDRAQVFRDYVAAVRSDLGRERFLLACWGVRPELVGLVDGCRIATDGFRSGCLAQYNSFNNVVWRNDPDHIELAPGVDYSSCAVTSLTGSLFMLTDRAERYASGDLEAVERALPVLDTHPGELYDVDPSRSARLALVDETTSGAGPTPFDGDEHSTTELFQLDLQMPWESWTVLASLGERTQPLRFADLGFDPAERVLVFDLWRRELVGEFRGEFVPPPRDPRFGCNLFCVRRALERPQLVATDRHVSAGALELCGVAWSGAALEGASELVAGDDYELWIREPAGFTAGAPRVQGAALVRDERRGGVRCVVLRSATRALAEWCLPYERR